MGIRIQPREVEIPEDDPFKNDLLDRRESVTALTNIIGSIDGPCVLAVDAPWGAGKTTFLKIWEQHLRNEKFPVISFNAWETDFSDDPFIALSAAISQELEQYEEKSLGDRLKHFKTLAGALVRVTAPPAIKISSGGLVDVTPLMELLKEIPQSVASKTSDRLAAYEKAQELLNDLSIALRDVARDLAKSKNGLPLVIVIDELDRCRPSYAVELLEAAKHIFAVDNIVFVLAVNRTELSYSISALYGSEFDSLGYLNRFFDIDFRLPDPTRDQFIETALKATQLDSYFNDINTFDPLHDRSDIEELLRIFFGIPELSLRVIAQAIHRLSLVFASLRDDRQPFALAATVALIIRTIDSGMYRRFIDGEIDDDMVADLLFTRPLFKHIRETYIGNVFEATTVIGYWQMNENIDISHPRTTSTLIGKYVSRIESRVTLNSSDVSVETANSVVSMVDKFTDQCKTGVGLGFDYAVERLELLSAELVATDVPTRN